jgi:hypothetical protein
MVGFEKGRPQNRQITCHSTLDSSRLLTLTLDASSLDIDSAEDQPSYYVNINGTALYLLSPNTQTFRIIGIPFS